MAELDELLNEEEDEIITLVDDQNNEVNFYHVATIDYKEKWYIFLQPVEPLEGLADDEVLIYELGSDEEGNDSFLPIEDEKLLDEVFKEFLKMTEEECECGECDCDGDCDCDGECDCEHKHD